MNPAERVEAMLLSLDGLSVGDCLGERFFGEAEEAVLRIQSRAIPGPSWRYTDDTEMALNVVETLLAHERIDQDDLARRFATRFTFDRGYGRSTYEILSGIREGRSWRWLTQSAFRGRGSFGNGSAMRAGPIGAYFCDDLGRVAREAALSAEVTHSHEEGIAGAVAVAVAAALAWRNRETAPEPRDCDFLKQVCELVPPGYTREGIEQAIALPADCGIVKAAEALGNGSGVTSPDTVPLCLWVCARHLRSFEEAFWEMVSALGDRDTTCAIVGSIVAMSAGRSSIPELWLRSREPFALKCLRPAETADGQPKPTRRRRTSPVQAARGPSANPRMAFENPVAARLADCERVLIAGAGGGFDIYAGLPLAFGLQAMGKEIDLANLSFTYIRGTNAPLLAPHLAMVTPEVEGEPRYFPERTLARWLRGRGLTETVYAFEKVGVRPLRAAYEALCRRIKPDAIVLVDGGTDILMCGDEAGLGTPEEDMTSMAAVRALDVPTKLVCCIGFGIDAYHGVCHAHFLENVAAIDRDGGYLGAFSVGRSSPEGAAFLDAVADAQANTPGRPSIVNGSIAAAVRGDFGNVQFTDRTSGNELFINPLMGLYFCFEHDAIAQRSLYLDRLEDTETIFQVTAAIEAFRHEVTTRPRRVIPH